MYTKYPPKIHIRKIFVNYYQNVYIKKTWPVRFNLLLFVFCLHILFIIHFNFNF